MCLFWSSILNTLVQARQSVWRMYRCWEDHCRSGNPDCIMVWMISVASRSGAQPPPAPSQAMTWWEKISIWKDLYRLHIRRGFSTFYNENGQKFLPLCWKYVCLVSSISRKRGRTVLLCFGGGVHFWILKVQKMKKVIRQYIAWEYCKSQILKCL